MINQLSLSVLNFKKIRNPFASYKIERQMILLLCTMSSTELYSEEIKNGSLHKCLSKHRYEENITKLVCLQEILCPSCWPESMNPVSCFPVVKQDHLPDS
jgi:hypothetical protein